jgi:hypothetical protein
MGAPREVARSVRAGHEGDDTSMLLLNAIPVSQIQTHFK